ncbi:MAG: glycoside hydrolase family 108 protein [Pseudomonadota bacterium]
MPSAAFAQSIPFVLRWEGGFVDHPADPGGRTNKGVTQKVYDRWRARQGLAPRDVKFIDEAEVHAIYETDYWLPPRCDLLSRPPGPGAVRHRRQHGRGARRAPAAAVRRLRPDGDFGPQTEGAVAACDAGDTVRAYCDRREAYYRNLADKRPELKVFLKGWLNRLNALRAEIGLPGYERAMELDFGETGYAAQVPDLEDDPRGF